VLWWHPFSELFQINALKRPVAQGNLSLTEAGQILVPRIAIKEQEEIVKDLSHRRKSAGEMRAEATCKISNAMAYVKQIILGEEQTA
jgi:hypothetical protein